MDLHLPQTAKTFGLSFQLSELGGMGHELLGVISMLFDRPMKNPLVGE